MTPVDAMRLSCERAKAGKDTISVTGPLDPLLPPASVLRALCCALCWLVCVLCALASFRSPSPRAPSPASPSAPSLSLSCSLSLSLSLPHSLTRSLALPLSLPLARFLLPPPPFPSPHFPLACLLLAARRQRAARLPDGPVPHLGARDLGEDALDRAAARGRGSVRDRRRRLRAQARRAVPQGARAELVEALRVGRR
eukprot:291788-Rhodomonas_salina.1